jgi:nucleoside-diphosphate-sugar epimerase
MSKVKVALITGVTGFIGSHLAKRLLDCGWQVHCLVRKTSHIERMQKKLEDKLHIHYLENDNSNLSVILLKVQPTVVFHLASLFLAQHKENDIPALVASNVTFGTQLVEAMTKNSIYNLVNTGTSWQHYQNGAYNPVNLYAATKEAFSSVLKFYEETAPLQVITLKLFDTYGRNDTRPKLFTLLKRLADTGEELDMSGGEQYIDIVHVNDVINAFVLSAEYLMQNQKEYLGDYAISSGSPLKLRELVEVYEKVVGGKLNINWGGRPYRPREVMIPWNTGRALPNWQAKIGLEEGIQDLIK